MQEMKKRGVLLALTNAVEGGDDEFNSWYNDQHLVDVLRIPGIVGAKRYRISTGTRPNQSYPWKYAAIYEIESDDFGFIAKELKLRPGTDAMPLSPALQDQRIAWFFEEIFDLRGKPTVAQETAP